MTTVKHNLKHNGAAYNESAELINPDPKVTSGEGRALCTCGAISDPLPTGGARRAWHKEHKAQAATAPQQAELVLGQDVAAGTPEDEVAEALAELVADQKPAKRAARKEHKQEAQVKQLSQDHPEKFNTPAKRRAHLQAFGKAKQAAPAAEEAPAAGTTHVLPFTTEVTAGFWRSLGRDAAKAMVDNHFPTVGVTANNNTRTLALQGPPADVEEAAAAVEAMWADALLAVKEWKKTDTAFLGRSTEPLARRQEGYHLTEDFFIQFGANYGA